MGGDLQGSLVCPRHGTREHLIEHDAHGIDVGACIRLSRCRDLGGDVGDGAQHVACGRHRYLRGGPGQTKVGDLRGSIGGNEDVFRLDVAVDDTDAVGGAQRLERVGRIAQSLGDRERSLCAQKLTQVGTVDEFHDEEPLAGDDALVEDGDHPRVDDASGGACFTAESFDEGIGVRQVWVHDLEGNGAVKAFVLRDVHGGHSSAGEPAGDPVAFVDQEPDQWISLVKCLLVAHLFDSMGVFGKSLEVGASVRRRDGVVLRS